MPNLDRIDRPVTRQELMAGLPKGLVMAELGVFAGDFAAEMLDLCQPSALHLIDRWAGTIVCGDQHGEHLVSRAGDDLYEGVRVRFQPHPEVTIHRAGTEIITTLGRIFDVVYVDADHGYQSVLFDLRWASEALRPSGGLLAGHDYTWRFPGVIRAVDQFCEEAGWHISALTQDGCPSYLLVRD